MLTLIVPCYSGRENLDRTIASARGICNEVVIISTALFDEDRAHFASAGKVVELPWNHVFHHGFGDLYNYGSNAASNDWLLLLGVAETVAEMYQDIGILDDSPPDTVWECDHINDRHHWKRVWNRTGGPRWSGVIHEEIVGGHVGGLLFRMQDTDKTPLPDAVQNEALKYVKTVSYNAMYGKLLRDPTALGGANSYWLDFVAGARESIEAFLAAHADMLDACERGDLPGFMQLVRERMDKQQAATGVSFSPQGT